MNIPNHYPDLETVNNLFKFQAQDNDLEYLFWQCKKPPVSSEIKPPSVANFIQISLTFFAAMA